MVVKQFGLSDSVLVDTCIQVPAEAVSNRVVDVKCLLFDVLCIALSISIFHVTSCVLFHLCVHHKQLILLYGQAARAISIG